MVQCGSMAVARLCLSGGRGSGVERRSKLEGMARTSARLSLSKPVMLAALGAAVVCARGSVAAVPAGPTGPGDKAQVRCLADGSGYFRARLRGALAADLNWQNAGLECEGGMRPDGHGVRVSFAGPFQSAGATHRLRLIFGIEAAGEGRSGHALPANLTLIIEGERRIFSTRGDNQCTVDELRQEPLGRTQGQRDYRVAARGFCVGPASSLTGSERVLVSRFDFAGHLVLYGDSGDAKPDGDSSRETTHLLRQPICSPGALASGCDAAVRRAGSRPAG